MPYAAAPASVPLGMLLIVLHPLFASLAETPRDAHKCPPTWPSPLPADLRSMAFHLRQAASRTFAHRSLDHTPVPHVATQGSIGPFLREMYLRRCSAGSPSCINIVSTIFREAPTLRPARHPRPADPETQLHFVQHSINFTLLCHRENGDSPASEVTRSLQDPHPTSGAFLVQTHT